jgi:hypothetical protein
MLFILRRNQAEVSRFSSTGIYGFSAPGSQNIFFHTAWGETLSHYSCHLGSPLTLLVLSSDLSACWKRSMEVNMAIANLRSV